LIYDHLARREVVDGLVNYPEHILRCHEAWLFKIRRNMLAKVEILYGRPIQGRMLSICDLERLPLWDRHRGIAIDAAKTYALLWPFWPFMPTFLSLPGTYLFFELSSRTSTQTYTNRNVSIPALDL